MRVALIHEWLAEYAGSERTLEQMIRLFPDAHVFVIADFLPPEKRGFLGNATVHTSFIQKLPLARTHFRHYLPLFPLAVEQHDLSSFDLVISNSHSVAKGATVGPDQLHICHCCSPMRYAWDLREEYVRESGFRGPKAWYARWVLHKLRTWDAATSHSVDHYVAISRFIAERIRKFYGRESSVVYPPVDCEEFQLCEKKEDFYLVASRQVGYKRIPIIVEAFARMPTRKVVVIGDGPDAKRIKKIAEACSNITLLGYQPTSILRDYMQRAKAFVFAAVEDFGIVLLEAQACGTPVIALRRGGAWETIRGLGYSQAPTGIFFEEQTVENIIQAVERFEAESDAFDPVACRENAERFTPGRFRLELSKIIEEAWTAHRRRLDTPPDQDVPAVIRQLKPVSAG